MLGRLGSGVVACRGWAMVLQKRRFSEASHIAPPPAISEEFIRRWKEVAPNLDLPKFQSQFMKPRPPVPGTIPDKVTVNLVVPHEVELEAQQVDMVMLPATTGQMGVLPGHVPTIAELRPGLLSIHEDGKVKTQYFVSSGFAFIHANSVTDIVAVEAVSLDQLDPEEVKKGLADSTQKLNTATTDLERAQAQIGIEVHSALSSALGV